jgi:virginiamycin B lyase
MIRQAVFAALLGSTLAASSQETHIPLAKLVAEAKVAVALEPGAGASDKAVWIPDRDAGTIVRVDVKDHRVSAPVSIGKALCASVIHAFNSVWGASCGDRYVARVDPDGLKVSAKVEVIPADSSGTIASGVGSIWVITDRKGVLSRVDPDSNAAVAEIHLQHGASSVFFAGDALWVTSGAGNRVTRINPHTNEIVESIEVGPQPGPLAATADAVWTLNRGDGSVTRVDVVTNKVAATIAVGGDMTRGDIAAGEGSVWISAPGVPLVRIDPRTNKVVQRFSGEGGGAVLFAHGSLWLAAGAQSTWRLDPKLVAAMRP